MSDAIVVRIRGMTCGNCARHAHEALSKVSGVAGVRVSLESGMAEVSPNPDSAIDTTQLLAAVEEAGYSGAIETPAARPSKSAMPSLDWPLLAGVALTLPMFLLEWGVGVGAKGWYHWVALALATPVQFWVGRPFYVGAWRQLLRGGANMSTLVSIGSTAAYAASLWVMFSGGGGHVYFMDSAAILTLVSLGHFFEKRTSIRAEGALRGLMALAPEMARVVSPDGGKREVPVGSVALGDMIQLSPGDRVPVDAVVLEGGGTLNEAMLTGESRPVEKGEGDALYAGTVVEDGNLRATVTGVGAETALSRIVQALERAQGSRADIQRLADKVSAVFVPVVVLIAVGTLLLWGLAPDAATRAHDVLAWALWETHSHLDGWAAGVYHAVAVLIIACPCAMGLATPIAIMAGANAAARRGVLVRDGVALEKSGQITTMLFDKTGTLTVGHPSVAEVWQAPGSSDADTRGAGALAAPSKHPLSRAIAVWSGAGEARLEQWSEVRGSGLEGRWSISSPTLRLGSVAWIESLGVAPPPKAAEFAAEKAALGMSVVAFASGAELNALFALRDDAKPNAAQVLESLRRSGFKLAMATGDSAATAQAMGLELGFHAGEIHAGVSPEGKLRLIAQLQKRGEKVAFVGDGINDAPALAQADLGVAMLNASDVARDAAGLVLLRPDLEGVAQAMAIARGTLKTIRQNLFWAFFYNALGVPLAALGFFSPIVSAVAMGLSDLLVVGNALLIERRIPKVSPTGMAQAGVRGVGARSREEVKPRTSK